MKAMKESESFRYASPKEKVMALWSKKRKRKVENRGEERKHTSSVSLVNQKERNILNLLY